MKGMVKSPHYKTGGIPKPKGLRNNRSKHNAKVRKEALERKRKTDDLMKSLEDFTPRYR